MPPPAAIDTHAHSNDTGGNSSSTSISKPNGSTSTNTDSNDANDTRVLIVTAEVLAATPDPLFQRTPSTDSVISGASSNQTASLSFKPGDSFAPPPEHSSPNNAPLDKAATATARAADKSPKSSTFSVANIFKSLFSTTKNKNKNKNSTDTNTSNETQNMHSVMSRRPHSIHPNLNSNATPISPPASPPGVYPAPAQSTSAATAAARGRTTPTSTSLSMSNKQLSATMVHMAANNNGHQHSKNPLRGAVTIIPNRLYFSALNTDPGAAVSAAGGAASVGSRTNSAGRILHLRNPFVPSSINANAVDASANKDSVFFFSMDQELNYWNFFLDFGPLNLGQLCRFTERLHQALRQHKKVCFYSSASVRNKRANATYCICAWQVLYLNRTPEEAAFGFLKTMSGLAGATITSSLPPLEPLTDVGRWTVAALPAFHDASPCMCTYDLTLLHCLKGLQKARQYDFFTWNDIGRISSNGERDSSRSIEDIIKSGEQNPFNVQEYEHFEQVENGDLNWIVQGKILAFAGPSFKKTVSPEGYCTLAPSDYIPYFQKKNVGLVVRLNKRMYDEAEFQRAGIQHLEQFYLDGSCPPMKILDRVVSSFEAVPANQAFAVHCKAGLGRTGTCIGAYLMKHYRFTASEAIGWMRICRPGMVIGPQQHFLEQIQNRMWAEGDRMRTSPATRNSMVRLCEMPKPSPLLASVSAGIGGGRASSSAAHESFAATPPSTPKRSKQMHIPSLSSSKKAQQYSSPLQQRLQGQPAHHSSPPSAVMVTPTSSSSAASSPGASSANRHHQYSLPPNGQGSLMNMDNNEAVVGRAGQADGLLAARAKRGGANRSAAPSTTIRGADPPASNRPTTTKNSIPVTPDPPSSNIGSNRRSRDSNKASPPATTAS